MSRVGKMPVAVPAGVDVQVSAQEITIKGAQGTLKQAANELVTVKVANGAVTFVDGGLFPPEMSHQYVDRYTDSTAITLLFRQDYFSSQPPLKVTVAKMFLTLQAF